MAYNVVKDYSAPSETVTSSYSLPSCFAEKQGVERTRRTKSGTYKGVKIPDYHRKMKRGDLLPLTPYVRFDREADGLASINAYYDNGGDCQGTVSQSNIGVDISGYDTDTWSLYARSGVNEQALLLEAVSRCSPDLDALTSAAEIGKTLDLILRARKRAVNLIDDLRSQGLRSLPKKASDSWLEWRYGWRILGYEVESITDFVNHPIRSDFIRGQSGESYQESGTSPGPQVSLLHTSLRGTMDTTVSYSHDLSIRALAVGKVKSTHVNALTSPVTTAWELIPYSFVADWFINVGDAIRAWNVLTNANIVCAIGLKRTTTASLSASSFTSHHSDYSTPSGSASGSLRASTLLRSPRNNPSLTPQLNVDLTTPRAIDIAALLTSTFSSRR